MSSKISGLCVSDSHLVYGSEEKALSIWDRASLTETHSLESAHPISAPPLIVENDIYVVDEGGIFYCYDTTGRPKWQHQFGTDTPVIREPVVVGDHISLVDDQCLYVHRRRS